MRYKLFLITFFSFHFVVAQENPIAFVETILINGPDNQYTDSSGIGGNYCISMLFVFQDDQAALTLNSQNLPFAIISMDISAIDINGCGGPFGLDTPVLKIKIYDSPGGVFSFAAPGTLLDEDTITGTVPGATIYTFNWTQQAVSMDIAASSDGNITVVFDLLQSGYAAIDNLLILSSLTSIDLVTPSHHNEIFLFPSPASDILNFEGVIDNTGEVRVYNLTGKLLLEKKLIGYNQLDVSALPPGMYCVEIENEYQSTIHKIIKN